MNISNLAQHLEDFAATENEAHLPSRQPPQMFVVTPQDAAAQVRRRLTLGTRRIQVRDSGLRHFRVF